MVRRGFRGAPRAFDGRGTLGTGPCAASHVALAAAYSAFRVSARAAYASCDPERAPSRQVLVFIAFIVGCVAASREKGGSAALGFAAIWTVILSVMLSVGGTLVMRKFQTSLAIGFFLGVVAVMSQQMLIIAAIFAGEADARSDDDEGDQKGAESAMAVFAMFLFVVYSAFAVLLAVFRKDLIRDETLDPNDPALATTPEAEADMPPAPK